MDAQEALETFLSRALVRSKRARVLGFIAKPKSRAKFLDAIYHDLENYLDRAKQVDSLPKSVVSMPGYKYQPPEIFGQPIPNLSEFYYGLDESYLVVTIDGKYGIHGPETYSDSRAFYAT